MCVYSNPLDWVIDFTLRYIENNGPVKLYNIQALPDCVYLRYLNTTQISAKFMFVLCVWNASVSRFLWQTFVQNNFYLLRLKISLARSDEHDEKSTCPTSDLSRKYEQASGFFEVC